MFPKNLSSQKGNDAHEHVERTITLKRGLTRASSRSRIGVAEKQRIG